MKYALMGYVSGSLGSMLVIAYLSGSSYLAAVAMWSVITFPAWALLVAGWAVGWDWDKLDRG